MSSPSPLALVRRLATLALVLAAAQIVFGAIVRISGSGLGCGDHWPKCDGHWFPPLNRVDLIIEVSHRYIAATLTTVLVALLLTAWVQRRQEGVSGRGGVLRPVVLAGALVVSAALLGAVTVWLQLANKAVIVAHLSLAMSLVAALVVTVVRSGGAQYFAVGGPPRERKYDALSISPQPNERDQHPSNAAPAPSAAISRAAMIAALLGFCAIVLGALTANVPGANTACEGFPLCRGAILPAEPLQYVQFTHRLIAFGLFLFIGVLGVRLTKVGARRMAVLARIILTLLFAQLIVAATMVAFHLPAVWRSMHAALGTLLWISLFLFAYVTNRATFGAAERNERAAVMPSVAKAGA